MPNYPLDFYVYAHPKKMRHLQMEVAQASQSQLVYHLTIQPVSRSRNVKSLHSSPSFTALPASSSNQVLKIYLGNSSFHLLNTQQEVFLQRLIIIQSPNRSNPLWFQSQSFPHPFSNYKDLLRKANLLFFHPCSNSLPSCLRFEL